MTFGNRGPIGQKVPKERGTEAAKRHIARVKMLPCVICGRPGPSDAHHCISERFGSGKRSDFDVIPLCKEHHQHGPDAIHNGKESWEARWGLDTSYLDVVRRMLG